MASKFIAWAQLVSSRLPRPPGNSVEAIHHAYSLDYDGVEMDIRLTKDHVAVLMHDDTVDATTDGTGPIQEMTMEEVRKLRLKGSSEDTPICVPTLSEALRANGSRGTFLCDMRVNSSSIHAIHEAVAEANFDPALLQVSAYNLQEGVRFKDEFPEAAVFLKTYTPAQELNVNAVVASVEPLDGLMVQVKDNPFPVSPLTDRLHNRGKLMVSFVHYFGFSRESFDSLVASNVDYILTMNHQYFEEIRETPTWTIKRGARKALA